MESEGTDADEGEFHSWAPAETLPVLGLDEVRFSRGFLRAEISSFFPNLAVHWKPLLLSLYAELEGLNISARLEFSDHLERVIPIEIDGEVCVLGWDAETRAAILEAVAPGADGAAADVVLEYLERRLVSTLALSWKQPGAAGFSYLPPSAAESVEVIGSVVVDFLLSGRPCQCWIGLSPRLVEKIDLLWREQIREAADADVSEDETVAVSVEIAELAVHPAMLIDYLREGTVVDLETPVSDRALIRVDGAPWGEGRLRQFNGRYAVYLENVSPAPREFPENTTRVQVQIARTEMDREALSENSQVGSILLTRTGVEPTASLTISGENVASAVIGRVGRNFALHILPK